MNSVRADAAPYRGVRTGHLVLLATLVAFGLRVYHLGYQSLWRDEADALRFATQPLGDFFKMFSAMGQNGPLYFLSLRPWLAAAGQSEFALRFPSAAFGTLAVPVAYGLLRPLAGRRPAVLFALFMAVAPYLVWYGQEAKMYALLTVLIPLSLWLAGLAIRRGRWYYWVGLYLVTSLAVYNHLLAPLAIPVQVVWLLLLPAADDPAATGGSGGRWAGKRWPKVLLYLAALGLPYLPVLRWAVPLALSGYQSGFEFVPLPQMLLTLAGVWSRGVLPVFGLTAMPMLLAVVSGAMLWLAGGGRGGWRLVVMLLAWVLLPPVEIFLISLGAPVYIDRYLIWAMPGFLALAALGAVALVHAWRPLGLLTLAAILALNLSDVAAQTTRPLKSDFRAAARLVVAQRQPGDRLLFQIPYSRYLFEYYAGPVSDFADGPYTNNGMSQAELDDLMAAETAGAPAVWLIASEVNLWDGRGLTEAWLNAHGTVVDRADFTLVSVTRYQLSGR